MWDNTRAKCTAKCPKTNECYPAMGEKQCPTPAESTAEPSMTTEASATESS